MRCGSRSAMKAWSATRRSILRSASWLTERKIFSAYGSRPLKAPSSGCVINELKNRGVEDILIAVVDGLKGFPEAITAVFPGTIVQTCIVHLIRHSMDFASWKDRKAIAGELRTIYRAKDAEAGEAALNTFDVGPWGRKYPAIAQSWRRNWAQVIPFFAFPVAVRRIIYTTNAIEALN